MSPEEKVMSALLIILAVWAAAATLMVLRNPFPFPDRGHRLFGVPDTTAGDVVLRVLEGVGLPVRMRFRSGPSRQALLWDNTTVINCVDPVLGQSGTALSIAVRDPESAARRATMQLEQAGYKVRRLEGVDVDLPPNHLVVLTSDAFVDWALAFRLHMLRMPKPGAADS
jgi:hypothetical protein